MLIVVHVVNANNPISWFCANDSLMKTWSFFEATCKSLEPAYWNTMIAQVPRISSPWKWKFRFYTMSGSVFYRCFWHEMRLAGLLDKSEKFSILSLAIARYLWWSETRLKKSFPSREWMIWMLKTLNQWSLGVPRFLSRHPHWFIMHWLRHLKKVGKIISTSWISRSIQFRGTKSVSKRDSRFSGFCCGWGNLRVEFKNIFAENKHEYMKGTSNIISVRYDTSRKDVLRNSGIDTSNEKCRISCKNGRRDRSFFVMFFRVHVIHTVLFIICQRRWQFEKQCFEVMIYEWYTEHNIIWRLKSGASNGKGNWIHVYYICVAKFIIAITITQKLTGNNQAKLNSH